VHSPDRTDPNKYHKTLFLRPHMSMGSLQPHLELWPHGVSIPRKWSNRLLATKIGTANLMYFECDRSNYPCFPVCLFSAVFYFPIVSLVDLPDPSVHCQRRRRYVTASSARQKHDAMRDLFRLSDPAHSYFSSPFIFSFITFLPIRQIIQDWSLDGACYLWLAKHILAEVLIHTLGRWH